MSFIGKETSVDAVETYEPLTTFEGCQDCSNVGPHFIKRLKDVGRSMSARSLPSGYVKTVLHNGAGRYVCQMSRLTLKFCKSHRGSRGLREFIENHLLEFANKNPGVVVYLQPRRHRPAKVVAEYLNGNEVSLPLSKRTASEVCQWVEHLRCRSGVDIVRLRKMWHTDTPSIQGVWTPFTNLDPKLAVTSLPDEGLSRRRIAETATEFVLRMAENVKLIGDEPTQELSAGEKVKAISDEPIQAPAAGEPSGTPSS